MSDQPGPSGLQLFSSPKKKRAKQSALSANEKQNIINIYKLVQEMWPKDLYWYKNDMLKKTAETAGVSVNTVYKVLKKYKIDHRVSPPKPPPKRTTKIDQLVDFELSAIRRKVHEFFFRNEIPTLDKILVAVNEDEDLPNFKKSTFRKLLAKLKFKYSSRSRKSSLIEKREIVRWRRKYLLRIKELREEGRKIYYSDETWLNEGHTQTKVWQDTTIASTREAHLEGLSTGLKAPSGKGKRLIIVHIGNEDGFLEGGELIFEGKKDGGDYHKEMNADVYEEWFKKVLDLIEPNSVLVIDNAPYHSRRLERVPNMSWRKLDIQNWLTSKGISFQATMIKRELIDNLVAPIKSRYIDYAVDKYARDKNIEVLRLPPYHCELNPIEMIWGQVKGYVSGKNKTFKMNEVKVLLKEGLELITPEAWQNCITHVIKEEKRMRDLDGITDNVIDSFIIQVSGEDASSTNGSSMGNSSESEDVM